MSNIRNLLQVSDAEKSKVSTNEYLDFFFCLNIENFSKVKKCYNKTDESIQTDIKALKEWFKRQPHLPQKHDENLFERILLRNKFQLEKTKQRLDKFYTLRGMYSEFFKMNDFESERYKAAKSVQVFVPMPKLNEKQERIVIYKLLDSNAKNFNFVDAISMAMNVIILMLYNDYSNGEHIIMDWTGFSTDHLNKFDVEKLAKFLALHQDAYCTKFSSIHFYNVPETCERVSAIFKPVTKPEIYNMVRVHRDLDSLYKIVSREFLPSELGGPHKSLLEIQEEWDREFKVQAKFFKEHAGLISDESKRIGRFH